MRNYIIFFRYGLTTFLVLCCVIAQLSAQTSVYEDLAKAEMKYWKLRARLRGDERNYTVYPGMMRVGDKPGMSFVPLNRFNNYSTWDFYDFWEEVKIGDPLSIGPCHQQFNTTVRPPLGSPIISHKDPREPISFDLEGLLEFGENPLITLGDYMAVLATEYHLLHKEGQWTTQVEEEIWQTLNLIDRIDMGLEPTYGQPPSLNGCLLRDDVPEDFALTHMDKKTDLIWGNFACPKEFDWSATGNNDLFYYNKKKCDGTIRAYTDGIDNYNAFVTGYNLANSASGAPNLPHIPLPNASNNLPQRIRVNITSGDEIGGLLYGMYFYKHFLPASATYNNQNIITRVLATTDRIMQWLTTNHSTSSTWLFHKNHPWVMQDPDGEPVCKGPVVGNISYSYACIAKKITGNSFTAGNIPPTFGWLCNYLFANYLRANPTLSAGTTWLPATVPFTTFFGSQYWTPFVSNPVPKLSQQQNFHMYAKLNAITGQFGSIHAPPSGLLNPALQYYYTFDFQGKHTIGDPAINIDWAIFDLTGSYFRHFKPKKDVDWWLKEFNKMDCNGACYQLPDNNGLVNPDCSYYQDDENTLKYPPWNTTSRWGDKPIEASLLNNAGTTAWPGPVFGNEIGKAKNPTNKPYERDNSAVFNGLDYMLAYNMWKVKFWSNGYTDRIRRQLPAMNIPYVYTAPPNPYTGAPGATYTIGTSSIPLIARAVYSYGAYQTKLASNAVLQMSAGSSVNLAHGFSAPLGSVFTAQIKKYDCGTVQSSGLVFYKKGDSTDKNFFWDFSDSLLTEDYSDSLSTTLPDDEQALLDSAKYYSSAYVITYGVDSGIKITIHPDWRYDSIGNLVYSPNSTPRHMQPAASLSSTLVYPNPAKASINIKYFVPKNAKHSSTLHSISGQYLQVPNSSTFSTDFNTTNYDISQLAKGFYILQLEVDGIRQDYKFVKE
jgi:Secretion system C-terminal sorting domain